MASGIDSDWLTYNELAERLGVSVKTLYNWNEAGRIKKHVVHSRCVLFSWTQVKSDLGPELKALLVRKQKARSA